MPKFKVHKYCIYETEIVADSAQDAATLVKYAAFKAAWKQVGSEKIKLYDVNEEKKIYFIKGNLVDDSES